MKYFFFSICLFSVSFTFSQEEIVPKFLKIDLVNNYYNENKPNKRIVLTYDTVSFLDENYSNEMETYQIQWVKEYKNKYIIFDYTGRSLGNKVSHGTKKYLVLFDCSWGSNWIDAKYPPRSENIALYDSNNVSIFFILSDRIYDRFNFPVTATSELREKDIIYEVGNILDISHLKPWVEGDEGDGVGEKITMIVDDDTYLWHGWLLILNGFIDYNRPYLYEYNNRVKTLRIYYDDNREEYETVELLDDQNFQLIEIKHFYEDYSGKITIEIAEIYPGSRYNDTCINYLQIRDGQ
jgi:hypothetical protein